MREVKTIQCRFRFRISILFLTLIALSVPCAWGSNYEGDFKGSTNQGYPVDLTVTANSVKMVSKYRLTGTWCTVTFDQTFTITSAQNLNGNFNTGTGSDRTTGSFNANTDSWSGTWTRYDSYCNANGQGTWQAARHITQPNISVNPATGTIKAFVEKSKGMTFKVLNTGDGSLIINGLKVSGVDSSLFKIENNKCSGLTISPSGSCTFDVVFLPLTKGEKSALVEIASNDPDNGTLSVQLRGIGMYPVNPAVLQLLLDTK
jgi:hypothetical protein